MTPSTAKGIRKRYVQCAIIGFNTLLLLILINVILGAGFWIHDYRSNYKNQSWLRVYTGINDSADYAPELIDSFESYRANERVFQPWTLSGPAPYQSTYLNVGADPSGIPVRKTINPDEDGNAIHIYAFGGSTTFGFLTRDQDTWPSQFSIFLNQRLVADGDPRKVIVTNYGRLGYHPTDESALFLDVLRRGHRPHLAIFMDGVNLGPLADEPTATYAIKRALRDRNISIWGSLKTSLPMVRLAAWLRELVSPTSHEKHPPPLQTSPETIRQRFEFHENLTKLAGNHFGLQTLLVSQPNGWLYLPKALRHERAIEQQVLRTQLVAHLKTRAQWLDLARLADRYEANERWTLTEVHYTPDFNRYLARTLADHIDLGSFQAKATSHDPTLATGSWPREKALYLNRPGQ